MKAHHLLNAHTTKMPPMELLTEGSDVIVRPRVYSTDRFAPSNNGIAIPLQLRERIAAAMEPQEEPESVEDTSPPFLSMSWGFL
jgi:hypothetical protein|nr:hypothetical protein [Neorhizobium tomejilense]